MRAVTRRAVTISSGAILTAALATAGMTAEVAQSQQPGWRVTASRPIAETGRTPQLETWLAVDHMDPQRMLATAIEVGEDGSALYLSSNGGTSWSRVPDPDGVDRFPGIDPVVVFGRGGTAWFMSITGRRDRGRLDPSRNLHLWRSDDSGQQWERLPDVPGGIYDRPWLAIGHDGDLFAAGKIPGRVFGAGDRDLLAVARSDDGGRSFRAPRLMMPPPATESVHAPTGLLVTRDGRIVMPFVSYRPPEGELPRVLEGFLRAAVSSPGEGFEAIPVAPFRVYTRAHVVPLRSMMGLGAGGVAQHMGRDGSGATLHVVWNTLVDDSYRVLTASSLDGGDSWTEPVPVAPHSGAGDQNNPAIAVNPDGIVGVVWNDFRDDPDNACYELYFSASRDGGKTFGPPLRVSDGSTCPAAPLEPNDPRTDRSGWLANGKIDRNSPAFRWLNGGDTQGLAALPDGSFVVVWPRATDGVPRLWFSRVEAAGADADEAGDGGVQSGEGNRARSQCGR